MPTQKTTRAVVIYDHQGPIKALFDPQDLLSVPSRRYRDDEGYYEAVVMPKDTHAALVKALEFCCFALSLRYGPDGDPVEGEMDVQNRLGRGAAQAYRKARAALVAAKS